MPRSQESKERCKEYDREYKRKWRRANPDKHRAQQLKYRIEHPDKDRSKSSKWSRLNPEKCRVKKNRRRALLAGAKGQYTVEQFTVLCELYGNKCLCCGLSRELTADHVVPLCNGGANSIHNIQPLCLPCNSKKGTRSTDHRGLR
jgi:5-methylcytosine-specific restriction endonuclease McrA